MTEENQTVVSLPLKHVNIIREKQAADFAYVLEQSLGSQWYYALDQEHSTDEMLTHRYATGALTHSLAGGDYGPLHGAQAHTRIVLEVGMVVAGALFLLGIVFAREVAAFLVQYPLILPLTSFGVILCLAYRWVWLVHGRAHWRTWPVHIVLSADALRQINERVDDVSITLRSKRFWQRRISVLEIRARLCGHPDYRYFVFDKIE